MKLINIFPDEVAAAYAMGIRITWGDRVCLDFVDPSVEEWILNKSVAALKEDVDRIRCSLMKAIYL